jgi:putative addiction module component (TIGR02574 family)
MIDRNNSLIREATSLPPLDKLQLVDYLLESLDMPDIEIDKLLAEESSRRWEEYKAGEIGSVSAAEVFEKYKP